MNLPIHFLHTCRSGGTLLCSLLSQNSLLHVTATNDLANLVTGVQNQWTQCDGFKAQGLKDLTPRIRKLMLGMIDGFYSEEFDAGQVVIDKSRAWLANIELIEDILECQIKIILPIRDIRDTVASLEKLFRENQITKPARSLDQKLGGQTIRDRCKQYLGMDAMLGQSISAIKDCFEKGLDDRLIVVPYHRLVEDPIGIVARIHADIGLPVFVCNPEKVENKSKENDEVHGRPYHEVRSSVDSQAIGRWKKYLPEDVAAWLDEEYPSIQDLANGEYRSSGRPAGAMTQAVDAYGKPGHFSTEDWNKLEQCDKDCIIAGRT